MCDPVTAVALAASAGGTYLETQNANKNAQRAVDAKNSVYDAYQIRQKAGQDQAGQAFNTNTTNHGTDKFDEQSGNEANRIKQAFGDIRTQPDYNVGLRASTPKNVVLSRVRESENAASETDRDVDNYATLNGYQGALFDQGLSQNEFARAFGNIQDKAGRDSSLLPMDLSAAETNSQKSPGLFPTLLKTAGQGLSLYGAANPGASFFNKTVQGPLPVNGVGPGAPIQQQGLFSKAFGGL